MSGFGFTTFMIARLRVCHYYPWLRTLIYPNPPRWSEGRVKGRVLATRHGWAMHCRLCQTNRENMSLEIHDDSRARTWSELTTWFWQNKIIIGTYAAARSRPASSYRYLFPSSFQKRLIGVEKKNDQSYSVGKLRLSISLSIQKVVPLLNTDSHQTWSPFPPNSPLRCKHILLHEQSYLG
jgi:hypothetical protein